MQGFMAIPPSSMGLPLSYHLQISHTRQVFEKLHRYKHKATRIECDLAATILFGSSEGSFFNSLLHL